MSLKSKKEFLNESLEFDVEYNDSFEGQEQTEKEAVEDWSYIPPQPAPLKVTSIEGIVDNERSEFSIILESSDGQKIKVEFDCYYEVGPSSNGNKRATLTIDGTRYNVVEDYMNNLENFGSSTLAVLELVRTILNGSKVK